MQLIHKRKTVSLIGLGKSVYDWINITHKFFDDFDGEIWTINSGGRLFRHDLLFDMHTKEWLERKNCERALRRREWLKTHDRPIVMPKAEPDIPNSIIYPLKEIIEKTSSCYFSNGPSYMLALAYVCNVERLRVFGFDFYHDDDRIERGRSCCEYWIGRLAQKGCRVEFTNDTNFMNIKERTQGLIYGYHEPLVFSEGKVIAPDYLGSLQGSAPADAPRKPRLGKRRSLVRRADITNGAKDQRQLDS